MATYYARSTMSNWNDPTGWSLTSGGASSGVVPGTGDSVIFDANSGTGPRTISGTTQFASLNTTAFAGSVLTFTTALNWSYPGTVNLGSSTSVSNLIISPVGGTYNLTTGASTLISGLTLPAIAQSTLTLNLTNPLVLNGPFNIGAGSYVSTSGFNVTCQSIIIGYDGASQTCGIYNGGTGTLTVNGFGTVNGAVVSVTTSSSVVGTPTLRLVGYGGGGTTIGTCTWYGAGGTVWNDAMGKPITFYTNSGIAYDTFKASPGTINRFASGSYTVANNFVLDGSGNTIQLTGVDTTNIVYLATTNPVVINYGAISNLQFVGAGSWRALRSTYSGVVSGSLTRVTEKAQFQNFI